jgi:hypothetical protein
MASTTKHQQQRTPASTKKPWLKYREGGKDSGGLKIKQILYQGPKGAIYLTAGKQPFGLNYAVEDHHSKHWDRSVAAAYNLFTPVQTLIKDTTERDRALKMIVGGLTRALEAKALDADQDFLADATEFIRERQREILQIQYFISSFAMAVALGLAALLSAGIIKRWPLTMNSGVREFSVAALLGGAGAMISVSQRFRSIEIERYMSRLLATVGGCSRILFGCAFGAVFLLFQKAGIVLSAATEHPWFLSAAALVAGFSERAIPEVLAQVERQIIARKTKSTRRPTRH